MSFQKNITTFVMGCEHRLYGSNPSDNTTDSCLLLPSRVSVKAQKAVFMSVKMSKTL